MTKIDWYILRKFISTFIYSLSILLVISIVIDITEKIDDFMNNDLSLYKIIVEYYFGFIPYIAALLFPLFIFISVIFFTSKMAYRTEIVAILCSGVSFRRFLRPYWVGAFLFGALLWAGNRWTVPTANGTRNKFERAYVDRKRSQENIYDKTMRIDSFTYVTFGSYDPNYKSGGNFMLEDIRGQQMYLKLKADRITWDSVTQKWKLNFVTIRTINGLKEHWINSADTSIKMRLRPEEMKEEKNKEQSMTTPQLNNFIKREELKGAEGLNVLYVERYRRTSSAAAVVILTLIGAIIASKKVRGGSGLHLAVGIVISASYIIFLQFSTVFSIKADLNPLLAVWIPNFMFGILAFWLYFRAPK
jgi:lipopolysaccharide export system permease protein